MTAPTILAEREGPVCTITLNRPERRNAVDRDTAEQLRAAFAAFDADADLRVAVLCGAGSTFCAGYDLKSLSDTPIADDPDGHGPMGPSRMLLAKPVIAAVEGYAVAGGLELALLCDLRVASTTAIFGVFCRRWGVPLIDGGTVRLPRLIGQSRALDMILTGREIDADTAFSFGLANRIVPAGTARSAATALAHEIARFPQLCMHTDRLSTYRQWGMDAADALRAEAQAGAAPLQAEAQAGAGRFARGLGRGGDFGRI